ncbi:MAG TPA: hypothetical protein VM029_20245 [Opitutaceae bacterium]|nr:hypothetical protein [Opitutaceae bacterium]
MNPAPPDRRAPLRCRAVRFGISLAGENAIFTRHIASCPACQRVLQLDDDLECALRRDARRIGLEAPIGLERRIMAAVVAAPRTEPVFRTPLVMLGAAAVAAVVLAFSLREPAPLASVARDAGATPEAADGTAVLAAFQALSSPGLTAVDTPAATLAAANPLRQEIESVYSDARFALGFLALNFLPTRTDAPRSGG